MTWRPGRMVARRRGLVPACAILALSLAAAACGWRSPHPTSVVVITLDTTRADRLSTYGYMNVSLPAIERLAAEGVVFDRATTVAPLTLPAHASLFTGLLPIHHGVRDNADSPLADQIETVAELLADQGFRTGAFVGSVVLAPDRGLVQGFQTYLGPAAGDGTTGPPQRRGDLVVDDALDWLDDVGDGSFLLWVHLYDPHLPYDPPEPYGTTYAHNPYVGEIAFADAQIDRLIRRLERAGRLDDTIIVVAADHGESLGAHGEESHGIFVYEDVVRVPLIIRVPGLAARRVGSVVRLIDVMPTALDWLGVASPPTDGVSLRPVMTGQVPSLDLEAYSESLYPERFGWSALRALSDGRFKFIEAPRPEFYDLERDPFEERNLFDGRAAAARAMAARLAALDAPDGSGNSRRDSDPANEVRERLASLGYLAAPVSRAPGAVRGPDPKDCIGLFSAAAGSVSGANGSCR